MKRIITSILLTVVTVFLASMQAQPAHAADLLALNAGTSAQLFPEASAKKEIDLRHKKLSHYLERHNSDLLPHAHHIIDLADKYELPWTLVAAISGVESTFCHHIPVASYNCWGWNNGGTAFQDYPDALETVSKALRLHYFDKGLDTPEKISPVYAPPSTTWAGKVRYFMREIEAEDIATVSGLQITL